MEYNLFFCSIFTLSVCFSDDHKFVGIRGVNRMCDKIAARSMTNDFDLSLQKTENGFEMR